MCTLYLWECQREFKHTIALAVYAVCRVGTLICLSHVAWISHFLPTLRTHWWSTLKTAMWLDVALPPTLHRPDSRPPLCLRSTRQFKVIAAHLSVPCTWIILYTAVRAPQAAFAEAHCYLDSQRRVWLQGCLFAMGSDMTTEEEIGNITDYLTDSFQRPDLRLEDWKWASQQSERNNKRRLLFFVYSAPLHSYIHKYCKPYDIRNAWKTQMVRFKSSCPYLFIGCHIYLIH